MCVAILSKKYRSCDTTNAHPANSSRASSKARKTSTSRSLLGSSRMIRFPPAFKIFASWIRFLSPPLQLRTNDCCCPPLKPNHDRYALEGTDCVPSSISSSPSDISSNTVLSEFNSSMRSCPTETIFTLSPILSVPLSGCSFPSIILISVDFPAPLGPITPTIPPLGREKDTSSSNRRSPNDLLTPSTSITTSPSLGPGGM
mmetsp:Transcript_13824/g.30245  ORF Transcript_13824/g.30245 Transcript_13824/m.30245 type:complete len:201 (+) Transcript_13824:195-797(+)